MVWADEWYIDFKIVNLWANLVIFFENDVIKINYSEVRGGVFDKDFY